MKKRIFRALSTIMSVSMLLSQQPGFFVNAGDNAAPDISLSTVVSDNSTEESGSLPYPISSDTENVSPKNDDIPEATDTADNIDPDWYEQYEYSIDHETGSIILESFKDTVAEVEIPPFARGGLKVKLGSCYKDGAVEPAFYNKKMPQSIIIAPEVTLLTGFEMFYGCENVEYLSYQTMLAFDHITNMDRMFGSMSKLKKIDLRIPNASYVTSLEGMFSNCEELEEPNISIGGLGAGNAAYMFQNCKKLKDIYLTDVIANYLVNTSYMFQNCTSLKTVKLPHMLSAVEDTSYMFQNCTSLENLTFDYVPICNIKNASGMFSGCTSLTDLDLSSIEFRDLETATDMFKGCDSLERLKTPKWVPEDLVIPLPSPMTDRNGVTYDYLPTGRHESMELAVEWPANWYDDYIYTLDYKANTITLTGYTGRDSALTIPATANINGTDYKVIAAIKPEVIKEGIDIPQLYVAPEYSHDLENVRAIRFERGVMLPDDCSTLFAGCKNLEFIDLSTVDTANVTDTGSMFERCINLKEIDLNNFNTENVNNMAAMFSECCSLETVNLSSFNVENVYSMYGMFADCFSLESIDLSSFKGICLSDISKMFLNCYELRDVTMGNLITHCVHAMEAVFSGCHSLETINIDPNKIDTLSVYNIDHLFYECFSLKKLDLSTFELPTVTRAEDMLYGCDSIIYLKTPRNVNYTIEIPPTVYLEDEKGVQHTTLPTGTASQKSIVLKDPMINVALSVSQNDGVYNSPLPSPEYDRPEGSSMETIIYNGILLKDGSEYGPTTDIPKYPGSYTVNVKYRIGGRIYSGSADFAIKKADWSKTTVKTSGSAGTEGRFDLASRIAENAVPGRITVVKGQDQLEEDPHFITSTLLLWKIKDSVQSIDLELNVPVSGADNYNDYNITIYIQGGSAPVPVPEIITLNDKEAASLKEAFSQMTDPDTDYVISIGLDIKEAKNLTIPKTAKSVTINGHGHTLELVGSKLTANAPLSLEQLNISAIKNNGTPAKFTLNTKKDLRICENVDFSSAAATVKCGGTLELSGRLNIKTFIAKNLTLKTGAVLTAPAAGSVTINGMLSGNGGSIELASGFNKPIKLNGTVNGTVYISGTKQADGIQILKCSAKKISADVLKTAFDVSAITDNDVDSYLYYFSSGKAMIFGESISYNGAGYGIWKDAVTAMKADLKSAKAEKKDISFEIELNGNVNINGSFKLPPKGYKDITLKGNGHTMTFTGDIRLTGNTVFEDVTLNKVDKKGNRKAGKVIKGKYTYIGPETL